MSDREIDKRVYFSKWVKETETESRLHKWGFLANNGRSVPFDGLKSINSVYTSVTWTNGPYSLCSDELCTVHPCTFLLTHPLTHSHTHTACLKAVQDGSYSKPLTKQIKSLKLAQQSGLGKQVFKRKLGGSRNILVTSRSGHKWTIFRCLLLRSHVNCTSFFCNIRLEDQKTGGWKQTKETD